jgi:hypothetical protein
MEVSILFKTKKAFYRGGRKLLLIFFSVFVSIINLYAQPVWTSGPNLTPGIVTVDVSFSLNQNSTVYYIAIPYHYTANYSAALVKSLAISGAPALCDNGQFTYSTPGSVATITVENFPANTTVTIYIVAESSAGVLQATALRLHTTTLPCPKIDLLTGFSQPVVCLNAGANATFQVVLLDPPTSGILKGTQWTIDWGDGTPITYFTSSVDYELPPLALRQHLYTNVSSCNYVFSSSVRNPCGETRSVQYVAVVHGTDVQGDGILGVVNNATGSSTIQVCEGIQSVITLQDNSTWNCQSPVLPGGLMPVPNSDPRNIEWLYGRAPSGTTQNTITGTVSIASLGNAPQTSTRITPSPYGSSSLSQAITIPATAKAGEYFRVYLKNWNKCNWADADYVSTYVDILVVASPPPPTAPNQTYCLNDTKTLFVTSAPVGTIHWYNSSMVFQGTGLSYTPNITSAGTYTFYVTDREIGGLACESVTTAVTLTVMPKPSTPTLSYPNKNDICYGVEPPESYTITASSGTNPPITGYQWFRDGVILPGRTYDTIIIIKPHETGRYTARSVGVPPTYCMSDSSAGRFVTVHTLLNVTQPLPQVICQNGTAIFHAETTEDIQNWQWEVSTNGGLSFSTVGSSAPYNGFNTPTLTITAPALSYNGYYYRVEMKTPNGQGGCRFKSDKALLTIDGLPTATPGPNIVRCSPNGLDPIAMTGATKGGTSSSVIWSGGTGLGTWTQNDNPALATFTPSVISGSFTATLTVTGTAACGGVIATGTRTITWSQTPVVEAGPDIARCDATPLNPLTTSGAFATGTYSALVWSGGAGLGTWTQNANPALAVFTPSVPSGSFTATLTATGSGACTGTNPFDTRIISWGQTPVAVAGPNLDRCDLTPLASYTMTGASATGTYGSAIWSGGAGLGTWSQNANPALATFTPTVTSGSFTATLTLTGSGACTGSNAVANRIISWSHQATVSAGPDQSICALATVQLAGAIGGGATSATWSGGGGTFSPNNTTLNAVYTPSAAERAAHSATLTLTTNDPAGSCPAVSDVMSIEIGTVISAASLTSSGNGCTGISSWLNVVITGGAPPYTIQYRVNGSNRPNRTGYVSGTVWDLGVLPAGTYTYEITVISDICGNSYVLSPPLSTTFTIYQQPVANAGSDRGVCNSFTTSLSAIPSIGTGSWSQVSGPGTISFGSVNSPATTATATSYGVYVVRWTEVNGVCTDYSDITVLYERLAAIISPPQNLCGTLSASIQGNTPAASVGTWTRVSGPGTVSFNPNANSPSAIVTASEYGTYVLRWTIGDPLFCTTSADITVTLERAAAAGADQHLCGIMSTTLAGNTPAVGSGTWTLVNAPPGGSVNFTGALGANTPAATATVNMYGSYVFRWTVNNGAHCTSNDEVTIVYNPSGQVNQPANQVVCNNSLVSEVIFSTVNTGGTTAYSWTNSAPGIGLAASGTGNVPSFTAINTGTSPVVATITVTPAYSDGVVSCPGPARTFTITVNPTAQVNKPADQVVCNAGSTTAVNFTTVNTGGTTSYTWSNSVPGIGLPASGSGNIASFAPVNTGTAPVTATITVTPLFTNGGTGCPGPSQSFTITVNPSAQVIQPLNLVICNTQAGSVVFNTDRTGGTTTYQWTNSVPGIGLAASGTGDISFTGVNTGNAPVTANIQVTPLYTSGGVSCTGPARSFTITVNPTGQVNKPSNLVICNGITGTVNFATIRTVGTTSYYWTNDNPAIGLGSDGTGNISFNAVNPGIIPISANLTVTPTFNYGSTDCPGPNGNIHHNRQPDSCTHQFPYTSGYLQQYYFQLHSG